MSTVTIELPLQLYSQLQILAEGEQTNITELLRRLPEQRGTSSLNAADAIQHEPTGAPASQDLRGNGAHREASLSSLRTQSIEEIDQALKKIQRCPGTPGTSVYANTILQAIRRLEEKSPTDPLLEFLFAFYDALAYQGLWATYTSAQYQLAEKTLAKLLQRSLNAENIEQAIAALTDAGFETLPYSLPLIDAEES